MHSYSKNLSLSFTPIVCGILSFTIFLLSSCNEAEDPQPGSNDMNTSMNQDTEEADDMANLSVAPDFNLTSLAGPSVKLSDYEKKVVVLFFFGYACSNCISVAPSIQDKINKAFNSKPDFAILGLDQWNGNEAGVQSFKNTTGVTFPLLMNASGTATAFSTTYDRLIVINKEGKIAYKTNSSANSSINEVITKINELL